MKITQKELEAQGWSRLASFGNLYVYGLNDDRILWNPVTEEIFYSYKKSGAV